MKPFVHTQQPGTVRRGSRNEVVLSGQPASVSQQLETLSEELNTFYARFTSFFITRTRSVFDQSKKYLLGLIQSEKKNMERMAEVVPNSNDQAYQHFMSESPWEPGPVLEQVALDVDAAFGGSDKTSLLIDESGFAKKGKKSVGVARQWNGRLGKVDNCQVGVYAALSCGDEVIPVNERLYLPKGWTDDPIRCEKAGIPEKERTFRTKSELALEMVREARRQGLRYHWVGLDAGYGKDGKLLRSLDQDGEIWFSDVQCVQRVYLEDPEPYMPERISPNGKGSARLVARTKYVKVKEWAAGEPETNWKKVILRDSTKGRLTVEVLHRRVWLWDGEETSAHCWHLIVRREIDSPGEIKYSLSNAAEATTTERLAYQQGQRYWVEQAFRNGKSELGLGGYQLRGWKGWHHHMAMVMLAMLFMLEQRRKHKESVPLLSCHDIVEVLRVLLPRGNVIYEDVFRQLEERHRRRQASIDSAYAKERDG